MPSGERYRASIGGKRYDVSLLQYTLLKKWAEIDVTKVTSDPNVKRAEGLVKQGLWRKRNGKYCRTLLGNTFLDLVRARTQPKKGPNRG
jgi:hypothetical protein